MSLKIYFKLFTFYNSNLNFWLFKNVFEFSSLKNCLIHQCKCTGIPNDFKMKQKLKSTCYINKTSFYQIFYKHSLLVEKILDVHKHSWSRHYAKVSFKINFSLSNTTDSEAKKSPPPLLRDV